MKISILTLDLSNNSLSRAYILAKVLQRKHEVEIAGFMFDSSIWYPLSDEKSITYKSINIKKDSIYIKRFKQLYNKIDGDLIYVVKPLFHIVWIGLLKKLFAKKTLLIDIDDWEMGFFIASYRETYSKLASKIFFILKEPLRFFTNPYKSFIWVFIMEKIIKAANQVTVSNSFLQKRFGGTVIYHGRDTDFLNPAGFNSQTLKQKYRIDSKSRIIMFFGTPRAHKGLEVLIEAVGLVKDENIKLVLVGIDKRRFCKNLVKYGQERLSERFVIYGMQSFEKVPEFMSIADIIVIPQEKSLSSIGQTPAKIFDAMAMAKPIIATDVSDLPHILDGCGWIVGPGDAGGLAEKIKYILSHPQEAHNTGLKARQKCIKYYSWPSMEKSLDEVFKNLNTSKGKRK